VYIIPTKRQLFSISPAPVDSQQIHASAIAKPLYAALNMVN
jgi:hypothetical protein